MYKLTSNLSLTTGNLESFTSANRLELSLIDTVLGFSTQTAYRYGIVDSDELYNEFYSKNFLFLYPRRRFYLKGIVTIEKSLLREYDLRWWAGVGLGFYVFRKKDEYLSSTLSIVHEHTDFDGNEFVGDPTESNIRKVRRLTFRFFGSHALLDTKIMFSHETWYQVSISAADDFRFQTFLNTEFPLSRVISFDTSLEYSYERVILVGREHGDLLFSVGLSVGNN